MLSQIKTTGSGDIGGAKNDTQKQELQSHMQAKAWEKLSPSLVVLACRYRVLH